jgi:hypothetical protein
LGEKNWFKKERLNMLSRRDMIGNLAGAVAVLGGGCRVFSGRSDSLAVSPPYEDVIRDRLWMWGHGGTAFDKPRHTAGIPPAEPIEMNDAQFKEQLKKLEAAAKEEVGNMKDIVAEMVPTYKRKIEV